MKTHRKSRSAENRNARKEMLARGTSPLASTLPPPFVTADRRWRRANRHLLVGITQRDMPVPGQIGNPTLSITLVTDERTRLVLGYHMS